MTTKMAAHEFSGSVLVIALFLHVVDVQSDFGKHVVTKLRETPLKKSVFHGKTNTFVLKKYQDIYAAILSFIRWTHEGPFYREEPGCENTRTRVNKFLEDFKTFLPRKKKNGWRLQMFHDMTHLW